MVRYLDARRRAAGPFSPSCGYLGTTIPDRLMTTVEHVGSEIAHQIPSPPPETALALAAAPTLCATVMPCERADCGPSMARRRSSTSCAR